MINGLTSDLPLYKYVDDVSIFECLNVSFPSFLRTELDKICNWSSTNNIKSMPQNLKSYASVSLSMSPQVQPLTVDGHVIDLVTHFKLLGLYISSQLPWPHHVHYICTKASKRLYALRTLKRARTSSKDLVSVYCSFVRPIMEYACKVWHFVITKNLRDQLEQIQRRALKIIFPNYSYQESLVTANLITLFERRESLCYAL